MHKYWLILLCVLLSGCHQGNKPVEVKKKEILIKGSEESFYGFTPMINNSGLKQIDSRFEGNEAVIRFRDHNTRKEIDLILNVLKTDTLTQYQISAKPVNFSEWMRNDTLKLCFNTFDQIIAGLHSMLYGPNYCWANPVIFKSLGSNERISNIQFTYWLNDKKKYIFVMPLGGKGFSFNMATTSDGLCLSGITGFNTLVDGNVPVVSISAGTDFYKLVPASFEHSFKLMNISENQRIRKSKPEMYNYLGWASWNAFMHDINEKKIVDAAKSLKSENIPVKWFLIDDGWLDVTDNKLNRFEPDRTRFPEFRSLTSRLKKEFGIKDIGVWHTLNGYWQGLNPSGELAKQYSNKVPYSDRIPWLSEKAITMYFVDPFTGDGYRFYDDWYKYLASQGMTFVKVDNQLSARKIADGNFPFWSTSEKIFSNLHSAAEKYYNKNLINCMDMDNSDYYHYSNSSIARVSEDYNPKGKRNLYSFSFMENAAGHVLACVHNSVWLSNIVWPDYDMFQSSDEDAWFYAIAKVMSNGPIYISDKPGEHDAELLKAITFSDGRVINADVPAMPVEQCLFQLFESDKPFKAFSYYGSTGLIAAWNASDTDNVAGVISPADIRDLKGNEFIIFDFFGKSVVKTDIKGQIPVTLDRLKCKFYSVIPVTEGKAVIGDINKIIPGSAVTDAEGSAGSLTFRIKEPGNIWIYTESVPKQVLVNSREEGKPVFSDNVLSVAVTKVNSEVIVKF